MTQLWTEVCQATDTPRYRFGTQRSVGPTETLRRIAPLLPRAGITRLADVTGLDWIGLPVYQAIRPNSRNISVSQGKGLTRSQAKVSALMESLESFHAECIDQPAARDSVGAMRRELPYDLFSLPVIAAPALSLARDLDHDPYAPRLGQPSLVRDATVIDWVMATDLLTGHATWLPRQLCELNFCVAERLCPPLFRASSNGLASGNTVAEALVHGLCEVIERDSLFRQQTSDVERHVDLDTLKPRLVRQLLDRFGRVGMRTRVLDVTGPTGVPCFAAFLSHEESPGQYYGAGCHPSRTTALLRALTEAAQSRLGHIAGSRDDLFRRSYLGVTQGRADKEPITVMTDFQSTPSVLVHNWSSLLDDLVTRVRKLTGVSPLAVDLRRQEFGLPVVQVIAPGLQLIPPTRR
jgi:ribosomal protein S12 methylthiotransferase accessory factor